MTPGLNILEWQAFDTRGEKEERDAAPTSSRSSSRVFDRMPVRLRLIEIDGSHQYNLRVRERVCCQCQCQCEHYCEATLA